jgi:uncharacterized protein YycO
MNLRTRLLNLLIPISKAIAYISRPEMKVTSRNYLDISDPIRNGDCLVSRTDWELSNFLLPGYWKHCAIYWNGWVYEATTHGVRKVLLSEFCFKKDHVGVIRPLFEFAENHKEYLISTLGKKYDWAFTWMQNTADAWYCSEYVYSFYSRCLGFHNFRPRLLMGEYTVSPTDYWNASKFFDRIYLTIT